jgi:hypothetical protein
MSKYRFYFIIILILFLSSFLLSVSEAQAISLMDGVRSECTGSGNCSVCDILRVVYNVGRFVFMSMAGVALILFLGAAIGLVFNWGSATLIAANKKLIFHTFLAVIIILVAYTVVNLLIFVLTGNQAGSDFNWQNRSWWQGPTCQ